MSESAANLQASEPRVLEYGPRFKAYADLSKVASLALMSLSAVFFISFLTLWQGNLFVLTIALVVAFLAAGLFYEYKYVTFPLSISKIQAFPDKILIKQNEKEETLFFENVLKLKQPFARSGFILLMKDGKKHLFSTELARVDYILEALINFNPELISEKDYSDVRAKLILSEHQNARVSSWFKERNRLFVITHDFLFPLLLVTVLYLKQSEIHDIRSLPSYWLINGVLIYLLMGIVFLTYFFLMNYLIDKRVSKRLLKEPANKTRDMDYESSLFSKLFPAYLISLFIVFGFVFKKDLNMLRIATAMTDSQDLQVKSGESFWYDLRFNCVDCKYSLIKNDIAYTEFGIARVIGVKGDKLKVNELDNQNMTVNDREVMEEVQNGEIALHLETGEKVILNQKFIIGKLNK